MFCRKCGKELPDDSLFCSKCGERVKKDLTICESCGKELPFGSEFCIRCGKRVNEPLTIACTSCNHIMNYNNGKLPRFCPKCGAAVVNEKEPVAPVAVPESNSLPIVLEPNNNVEECSVYNDSKESSSNQIICPRCRTKISEDSPFCPKCGATVTRDEKSETENSFHDTENTVSLLRGTIQTSNEVNGVNSGSGEYSESFLKSKYGKPFIGIPSIVFVVALYVIMFIILFKGDDVARDAGFHDSFELIGFNFYMLPAINVFLFFRSISMFGGLISVNPVGLGTYILCILTVTGSGFIPAPYFGYVVSVVTILIALYSLAKLQTVSRYIGTNILPGIVLSAFAMTTAGIVMWATDCFEGIIAFFVVVILVHFFIMGAIRYLWNRTAIYIYETSGKSSDSISGNN